MRRLCLGLCRRRPRLRRVADWDELSMKTWYPSYCLRSCIMFHGGVSNVWNRIKEAYFSPDEEEGKTHASLVSIAKDTKCENWIKAVSFWTYSQTAPRGLSERSRYTLRILD